MSQPQSAKTTTAPTAQELTAAVHAANVEGNDLEKAAAQIVEQIGMPVFREALAQQPELKQLTPALVVDLISSALAMDIFDNAGPDEDVIVQLQNGYVTVPAAQREILQSGVTRILGTRRAEIEQLLAKGKQ
ncbi:hypothetical protein [Actinokineospora sp.]|uniref:hypothetical protein n=1 Tax=Actinokineospora sp. TaxID=1872133 RepID=UPI0040378DA0